MISLRKYVRQLWPLLLERAMEMGFVPRHRRGRRPKIARHAFLLKLDDPSCAHLPDWVSTAQMSKEMRAHCLECGPT